MAMSAIKPKAASNAEACSSLMCTGFCRSTDIPSLHGEPPEANYAPGHIEDVMDGVIAEKRVVGKSRRRPGHRGPALAFGFPRADEGGHLWGVQGASVEISISALSCRR